MAHMRLENYDNKRLARIGDFCRKGSVLDLGYAQQPNPYINSTQTTGVDLQPNTNQIRYSREIVGDILSLQSLIPGERFNNVIAGEFIEHIERPYDFLRDVRHFISPDGRLILSTPNPSAWPTFIFELLLSKKFFYTNEHKYYFPPRWVMRMLNHCGYAITSVKGVGLWGSIPVLPCPTSISYQVIYVARPAI